VNRHLAHDVAPLGIVYSTDTKVELAVKVIGALPDNSHDPIISPVADNDECQAAAQYLTFQHSTAVKSIVEGYGFSVLARFTPEPRYCRREVSFFVRPTSAFGTARRPIERPASTFG
jgi:hypothetical protein